MSGEFGAKYLVVRCPARKHRWERVLSLNVQFSAQHMSYKGIAKKVARCLEE